MDLSVVDSLPEGYPTEMFALTEETEKYFECGICCKNGHLFCRNCVGRWSVRANNSHPICECQTDVKRSTAEVVDEALRRASNRCPLCAVIGPYLTATGVDCQLDQVMVLCTRCDWAGPFVDFKTKHCCSSGLLLKRKLDDRSDDSSDDDDGDHPPASPPPAKRVPPGNGLESRVG